MHSRLTSVLIAWRPLVVVPTPTTRWRQVDAFSVAHEVALRGPATRWSHCGIYLNYLGVEGDGGWAFKM